MSIRLARMRSAAWLSAVRELECCVICRRFGVQAAHRNQGKGMGMKAPDCWTAALCHQCHAEIDNGRDMSLDERRRMMDVAVLDTIMELFYRGAIGVIKRD